MTIIRPNDNQKKIYNLLLGFLGLTLIALMCVGIFIYGTIVDLRHDMGLMQKDIQYTELTSAKLQNQVYGITDIANLEKKAAELGLVKEPSPQYLNLNSAGFPVIAEQAAPSL